MFIHKLSEHIDTQYSIENNNIDRVCVCVCVFVYEELEPLS
jgi:hypothetical protein